MGGRPPCRTRRHYAFMWTIERSNDEFHYPWGTEGETPSQGGLPAACCDHERRRAGGGTKPGGSIVQNAAGKV